MEEPEHGYPHCPEQGRRPQRRGLFSLWLARGALAAVFTSNVSCAVLFLLWPERYAASFEVSGVSGETLVRGLGILFLMWNATYPLTFWSPWRYRHMFLVLITQQAIGLIGESVVTLTLPSGHPTLITTGRRFIIFDGLSLLVLVAGYVTLHHARSETDGKEQSAGCSSTGGP